MTVNKKWIGKEHLFLGFSGSAPIFLKKKRTKGETLTNIFWNEFEIFFKIAKTFSGCPHGFLTFEKFGAHRKFATKVGSLDDRHPLTIEKLTPSPQNPHTSDIASFWICGTWGTR